MWEEARLSFCIEVEVEEIEGKGSPNENPDSPNESSSQDVHGGRQNVGEGMRTRGGVHEESSRNTSVSSHSDVPPDRHSDSTTKTHDSSRSPSESPANRSG
ncbi:unnamed protein product [Allacma fusca]|uniref:Uncharacterized protein n=1 Tax=Allacma fusca TaxID=39272 RepID=A0A8J2KQW4_9HEXA|nr:unnamed protein product [Allacma fusca]